MLIVQLNGRQIDRHYDGEVMPLGKPDEPIEGALLPAPEASDDVASHLSYWSAVYARAVQYSHTLALEALGDALYSWLDPEDALTSWLGDSERALEIRVDPAQSDVLGAVLLALPWELLRWKGVYLADDKLHIYTVVRRCNPLKARAAQYADLRLLFMAASPNEANDLNYEGEEIAIIEATASKLGEESSVQLQVEESGSLEYLAAQVSPGEPFEVLHLSAHGNIGLREDPHEDNPTPLAEPVLALENAFGEIDWVGPEKLIGALVRAMPSLVFLSACRSAERGASQVGLTLTPDQLREGTTREPCEPETSESVLTFLADPFARQLCIQVPNVIGWDGSVADIDATAFAKTLYRELGHGVTIARAIAVARRTVHALQEQDPRSGQHWHLARLYLGPGGGGALCAPGVGESRSSQSDAEMPFLDRVNQRSPVTPWAAFVGRRRAIQTVIKAYRDQHRQVLIHGMSDLGKSSLAARVAGRLSTYRIAVVFGQCDALSLFEALAPVMKDISAGMRTLEAGQTFIEEFNTLSRQVVDEHITVEWALLRLFNGLLESHPTLLILDGLEQSLTDPTVGQRTIVPNSACRETLNGVLLAFSGRTRSRLLMTSRYDFTAPGAGGHDNATSIVRVGLAPMTSREQMKQWRARAMLERKQARADRVPDALLQQALDVATGNPGLQSVLTQPFLAGEIEKGKRAIEAVETYRQSGELPSMTGDLENFFRRMSFDRYRAALTENENIALSVTTLFELPVPRQALEAAMKAVKLEAIEAAIERLLALGLIDDWGERRVTTKTAQFAHYAINQLVRPLAVKLDDTQHQRLAEAALPALVAAWQNEDGVLPADPRSEELVRLILLGVDGDTDLLETLEAATTQAIIYRYQLVHEPVSAHALAKSVFARFAANRHVPGPNLLFNTIKLAEAIGDAAWQDTLLEGVSEREDIDGQDRVLLLSLWVNRLTTKGELDRAQKIWQEEQLLAHLEPEN